ncbi:uncharacterized protein BO97DRAFT_431591 [Aspergillus homomorphus CBS 101889]|uniref:Uncharacterized protein n=1 Tax=Aspergillus homomorphus (strain CBS 101889) TaxID=1450537 RepID=A0A395I7E5_ASPHC|nr:hypothetical protein BO97DRAFT_431591 [Aspergillus homomorphus CBS 101889]RAL15826.1 hypothetical protein BO97DRAFT_431591 [Aspergillus homomorphus CBS 101889]
MAPVRHPPNVPCAIVPKVSYTFYGYPDNDPPGADIAYDCGRGYTAGGIGTYANPLTFATAPGEFAMCELVYSPYLRKYLLHEDYCESCTRDWADRHHPVWHVDIWLGRNSTTEAHEQLSCENRLTPDGQSQVVIRNPERNLPVDEMTFYAGGKASCGVEHVYPQYAVQEFC